MKATIVYDSGFGNTKRFAEAIKEGLEKGLGSTESVGLVHVSGFDAAHASEVDLLIVGSPTNGFRATPAIRESLKRLARGSLRGVGVAAFDTRFTEEKIKGHGIVLASLVGVFGYAAKPIADQLVKAGGKLLTPPEGFFVDDTEGPPVEGELERAAAWAAEMLSRLHPEQAG